MSRTDGSVLRRVACGFAAISLGAAAMAQTPSDAAAATAAAKRVADSVVLRELVWRAGPADERPEFRGVVSYDGAGGGTGQMLYPAAGAAGLLVAILTHAAINEGARSAETKRIEEAADWVLRPFVPAIDRLVWRNLQRGALDRLELGASRRLAQPDETVGDAWLVEARPVFRMTQDRRALVVETVVRVFDGAAKSPLMERAVRVVSPPVDGDDVVGYWAGADGVRLAEMGAALAAEAVRAAFVDVQVAGELPQKTVRFVEGAADKFERATPLAERCGRLVLRTLRGGILSVPMRPTGVAEPMGDPAACGAPWPPTAAPVAAASTEVKPAAAEPAAVAAFPVAEGALQAPR